MVDAYRRVRNTLKFLLANVSDFDPAGTPCPLDQMLEIDRYALAPGAVADRHPGALQRSTSSPRGGKLQVYCSEDLGAFYLDVLRTASTPPQPKLARVRRKPRCGPSPTPCCAGWHRSSASPPKKPGACWARRARPATQTSIFLDTYLDLPAPDEDLLASKWGRIREIREQVNKDIETVRPLASWSPACRPR